MKKVINVRLLVFVMCIVLVIFVFMNGSTIQNLITSNSGTNESEIKNLGVTDEAETESWDENIVSEIIVDTSLTDDDGDIIIMYVPIPAGYTASDVEGETTVKEGLVIYEGTDKVSTDEDAKTTRNQYVWVPVNPSDVYWTDSDGSVYGKEYSFTSTGRSSSNVSREPLLPTSSASATQYYEDRYLDQYFSDMDSALELQADMQKNFAEVIESIETYGGFYIGRYEAGDGDLTGSFRGSSSGYLHTPVSMQGKAPYNYVTWYQAYDLSKEFAGTNESVNSCLIYGCLWDATLEYLVETGDKTYAEIVSSAEWGNYYGVSFSYTNISGTTTTKSTSSTLIPTGATDRNSACNIYDLAGNMWEWTQEGLSSTSNYRYTRRR